MNVVVINDFAFVNGGASKIAVGSAIELARSGHMVTVFSAVGPVDKRLLHLPNLQVICLHESDILSETNRVRAVVTGIWNQRAGQQLVNLLGTLDPFNTVVHVHMWNKALSPSVIHSALELSFPVVLTLHDYFIACPTGTYYHHGEHAICPLKAMSGACIATNCDSRSYATKLWRVGRQLVQAHIGGVPDKVLNYITISDLSEEVLSKSIPAKAKLFRVPNFIDIKQAPPVDVSANHYFTFSGRLSPEKGPLLLAECAQTLEVASLFIGDGVLRCQIEASTPKATCTGWLDQSEAIDRLRMSRALVFPSLWYETQGLVVAEAAAMGIPAIVPDNSAAREWIRDGQTGLLFEGGNKFDLAAKMAVLKDNPDVASRMGRAAYDSYWQNPALADRHADRLIEVYGAILRSHNYA